MLLGNLCLSGWLGFLVGKQELMALGLGSLPSVCATRMEPQALGFNLAVAALWSNGPVGQTLSFPLPISNKQIALFQELLMRT